MRRLLWIPFLTLIMASAAVGQEEPPFPGEDSRLRRGGEPSQHQDSVHLGLTTSGILPADGLLAIQLGMRSCTTVYTIDDQLETIDQFDWLATVEATPRPWLAVRARLPWRSWSGGTGWVPNSGNGIGDGDWQLTLGGPSTLGRFGATIFAGGNIPIGGDDLGEGVFSPHAGAALTCRLFRGGQAPEMRLHLNVGYRWNKEEENGYGMGENGFEPWAPRYPSADFLGGAGENDQMRLRAAIEFRKQTTSLYVEYAQDRFGSWDRFGSSDLVGSADLIGTREQFSSVGAGFRWGVMEGWGLHGSYLVSLIEDDLETDWDPAFPEWVMQVGISRQFGIGGRDRDDDGIVDRHDHCPLFAEDLDGFMDEDGCPDEDNDLDGIPDALDLEPMLPEDIDGFEDHDGRPEYDNDGDGVLDKYDLCPNDPEDIDGHRDEDGCPDDFVDSDKDGVEDSRDRCPNVPEDKDGFADDDGCPDLDNDLDGIPDDEDACPDEPEDYDGVQDDDGCPEEG